MSESWLLIETSGRVGKVGLARDGAVVRAADLDASRRHARDLTVAVDAMLQAEGLHAVELTGVMVGRGPGSYTGLRVGIISAKALAYATGCKLVAVETFAAIVRLAPTESRVVWVIADAMQDHVYIQRFARADETAAWIPTHGPVEIQRVDESLHWLPAGVWVSGPGVKVYADRIPQSCHLVPEADREPSIESLFQAGEDVRPLTREELFALEPLYLRGSSAEEKAKAQQNAHP